MISFGANNPLAKAISEKNWAQVRVECMKRPKYARQWIRIKNETSTRRILPLHLAAGENVPLSALEALINANSQALTRGDSHEQLPMHMACQKNDYKRVASLLKHAPSACRYKDQQGQLPLHHALLRNDNDVSYMMISKLLEANPNAAACKDKDGWLPLHRICMMMDNMKSMSSKNAILMVVQELAEAYPEAILVAVPGRSGESLLEMMMQFRPEICTMLQEEAEMLTKTTSSPLSLSPAMQEEEMKVLLKRHRVTSLCRRSCIIVAHPPRTRAAEASAMVV